MYSKNIKRLGNGIYRFYKQLEDDILVKIKSIYSIENEKYCSIYRFGDEYFDFRDDPFVDEQRIIGSEIRTGFNKDTKVVNNYLIVGYQISKNNYMEEYIEDKTDYYTFSVKTPYNEGQVYFNIDMNYSEIANSDISRIYILKHDNDKFNIDYVDLTDELKDEIDLGFLNSFVFNKEVFKFSKEIPDPYNSTIEFDNIILNFIFSRSNEYNLHTIPEPFSIQFIVYSKTSKKNKYPYI